MCTWWRTLYRVRRIKWQFVLSAQCYYWTEILSSVSVGVCACFFFHRVMSVLKCCFHSNGRKHNFTVKISYWVVFSSVQFSSNSNSTSNSLRNQTIPTESLNQWTYSAHTPSLNDTPFRMFDNLFAGGFVCCVGFCSMMFAHRNVLAFIRIMFRFLEKLSRQFWFLRKSTLAHNVHVNCLCICI